MQYGSMQPYMTDFPPVYLASLFPLLFAVRWSRQWLCALLNKPDGHLQLLQGRAPHHWWRHIKNITEEVILRTQAAQKC